MKKYLFLFILCILCSFISLHSQNVNQYKYVIVPIKYDFLLTNDQYKLNSLTEFLFEKYGFIAILEGEKFPEDMVNNPCSALNADVLSDSGMFSFVTKVTLVLKNCNQQIIFESKEGQSKLKDRKFGYQEALRDAFSSIEALHYSYSAPSEVDSSNLKKEVEKIEIKEESKNPETNSIFHKDGISYLLEKQANGFLIKNQVSKDTIAHLNKTSRGDYIFRSKNSNGTAYFDEKGNLMVEYFDVGKATMKKEEYLIEN